LTLKQVLDFAVAGLILLITAPLFLLVALCIKATSSGPVFFVQQRVGRGGRAFRCYKFRTMQHNSDDGPHREFARNFIRGNGNGNGHGAHGHGNGNGNGHSHHAEANGNGHARESAGTTVYKMTRDPRITRVGQMLRRTSLDELPQILNVLRGEMSLVGPRPPVLYELEHYQDWHKRRLTAKPGITGLWQVSGRSSVPFDEMVQLDLYYIDHRSTLMDLWIMARTLPVMVKGDGAY
jgi:lipopolysaccharide/colanic/teichoic acid biosynthesis glycosyltransferase